MHESLIQIYELPPDEGLLDGDHFNEAEESGYHSQLNLAQTKRHDPLSDVADEMKFLIVIVTLAV